MGAWGTGIFDDDTALDVQGDWIKLASEPRGSETATSEILREYSEALEDIDERAVIWLALAQIEIDHSCLTERVKQEASQIIEAGVNLQFWKENANNMEDVDRRAKVLKELESSIKNYK